MKTGGNGKHVASGGDVNEETYVVKRRLFGLLKSYAFVSSRKIGYDIEVHADELPDTIKVVINGTPHFFKRPITE